VPKELVATQNEFGKQMAYGRKRRRDLQQDEVTSPSTNSKHIVLHGRRQKTHVPVNQKVNHHADPNNPQRVLMLAIPHRSSLYNALVWRKLREKLWLDLSWTSTPGLEPDWKMNGEHDETTQCRDCCSPSHGDYSTHMDLDGRTNLQPQDHLRKRLAT